MIYEYYCKDCGESFESPNPQTCCAECISLNIKQYEIRDKETN